MVPQAPQFEVLVDVSTQAPLQAKRPLPQEQLPLTQVWPAPQVLPQAPQLLALVFMSTHAPLQAVKPLLQKQPPLTQV